jgi:RNA polymerase sigma-70 factor (ECF subfamily)
MIPFRGGPRVDERRLIEAAARGDREAFETLARAVHEQAYRIARRILGSREEAADLVQRACLRLWEILPRYRRQRGDFRSWYCKVVVNLAIDQHRRLRLQRRFEVVAEAPDAAVPARAAGGPEQELSASEVERVFERVAAFLSPQQRAAFTLVEVEGMASAAAAEVMGVRPSTVRNHLLAARAVLRGQMRRLYPEYCRGLSDDE